MSYALNGVNFTDQQFTPSSDCAIWRKLVADGILEGMAITAVGSTLNVAAGWLMAGGKQLQLPAAISVPCTGASSGKARLVVNVDLSKTATEETFSQGWIDLEYEADWTTLTQDDLAGSGTIYLMVLAVVELSSGGITGIVQTCGEAYGRGRGVAVTLPAASWAATVVDGVTVYRQTTRVDGVLADATKCNVTVSYAWPSKQAYQGADVDCIAQGDGTLTWNAVVLPTVDITANVLLS